MYTSSPQTFIFKYIFPFIMLIGGAFGFIFLQSIGDDSASNFAYAFGIAFLWNSIFMVQMPFRLKKVEVDDHGLKIEPGNGEEVVPFKDVISVSKFGLSAPFLITVKYSDSNGVEDRKASYMINSKYQRFMKEDEMTKYLTERSRASNPNFEESSALKNIAILFLAGLPFFIGMGYFMSKTGFNNF